MSNFHVGQKVVLVDDSPFFSDLIPLPLKKGGVYTIGGFEELIQGGVGVLIEELNPERYGALRASRFRPVVTTDISIFTAMLTSVPRKEPVARRAAMAGEAKD